MNADLLSIIVLIFEKSKEYILELPAGGTLNGGAQTGAELEGACPIVGHDSKTVRRGKKGIYKEFDECRLIIPLCINIRESRTLKYRLEALSMV